VETLVKKSAAQLNREVAAPSGGGKHDGSVRRDRRGSTPPALIADKSRRPDAVATITA
jgi:hypothetical protein